MTLAEFDRLSPSVQKELLFSCCGSHQWVKSMMEILPARDLRDLLEYAEENWFDCNPSDWLEAFTNDSQSNNGKDSVVENKNLAEIKKKTTIAAKNSSAKSLVIANQQYEEIFGYRFISSLEGKPEEIILTELEDRLKNDPREEIAIAAREQDKITRRRLKRLFS